MTTRWPDRREDELWFIECSHNTDCGWQETEVTASWSHADAYRRLNGYRPLPLVQMEGWTNDVWFKPVYMDWETLAVEEEVNPEDWDYDSLEQAEITQRKLWTP